jgi:hypothetical protein
VVATRRCRPGRRRPDGAGSEPAAAAAAETGAARGGGRRPSMSSQFSGGVAAMTLVKLTFSLATVSATIPASRQARAVLGSVRAAAAPSIAPSALAPASPSIARSPRSSGSSASAAPTGAATACGPDARASPAAMRAAVSVATLMARPGRRSKRLSRFAPPAISPALMAMSAGSPPSSRAAPRPVTARPASLIVPVVTSPCRSAPRCPRSPRRLPEPRRSSSTPNAAPPRPAMARGWVVTRARSG